MISISPAVGWYAVFDRGPKLIRIPVAFFESLAEGVDPVAVFRRIVVFDPRTKMLIDAQSVPQFQRLEYEPLPSRQSDRRVNLERLNAFLGGLGVSSPEKEVNSEVASAVKKKLGEQRAAELIETLEDKDAL